MGQTRVCALLDNIMNEKWQEHWHLKGLMLKKVMWNFHQNQIIIVLACLLLLKYIATCNIISLNLSFLLTPKCEMTRSKINPSYSWLKCCFSIQHTKCHQKSLSKAYIFVNDKLLHQGRNERQYPIWTY